MKLEVLLSVMNLDKKDLKKMNITSKCIVIDQCNKEYTLKYNNFDIYGSKDKGLSNSRNLGLSKAKEDIILLCDDDIIYEKDYEKMVLEEFKNNKKADIIIFNIDSPNRKTRINKKNKRLHFYNVLNYPSYRIAFRRKSIGKIRFNTLFGSGSKYQNGEESIFLVEALRNKLNIYSSNKDIGIATNDNSYWFNGYDEKYLFNKGAIFSAISKKTRHLLMIQYLIRHKEVWLNNSIFKSYKEMKKGSKDYLKK